MKKPNDGPRRETAAKVAALTLANAFIFQEQLAIVDTRVKPLRKVLAEKDLISAFEQHWKYICEAINYVPIFRIAREVLLNLPSGLVSDEAVDRLARRALEICAEKAALRHDLMGRIFHWLLHHAKYLGTYYTSVPAATLLLKLALAKDRWALKWDSIEELQRFKIADLACGTGTLLMAASQAITDNFIRSAAKDDHKVTDAMLRELHRALMEEILHGYDVLPSAVHLTASTLALLAPEIAFHKMQLYSLPLGKTPNVYLGSIEFLNSSVVQTQFDLMRATPSAGVAAAVTGKGLIASQAPLPELDLCVMNPPFVRSVGGNLLFGSMPGDRAEMQKTLRKLLSSSNGEAVLANTTAGLGSVFTAVADRHIKAGGRLALVLPAAVIAWSNTRKLIEQKYDLELVIASHEADHWNFSENTDLSEVLIVARKKATGENHRMEAVFVNLWHNPMTSAEALAVADAVLQSETTAIGTGAQPKHGVTTLLVGNRKYGEAVSIPHADLQAGPWIGCSFAQTELVRTAWHLSRGGLLFPGSADLRPVEIVHLRNVASLGPDRRDIYDGFERSTSPTSYPALWGHHADAMTSIAVEPNMWLLPRAKPALGRPRRPVELLWPRAGAVMIAERLRLNTQRLTAVLLNRKALSNVWWPVSLKSPDDRSAKALALWFNSSLGLVLFVAHRVPTEGCWVSFKKPNLEALPVLNVLGLSENQLKELDKTYDAIAKQELLPFSQIAADGVRATIDAAFAQVLGLGDLSIFREMLGREPIITNISIGIEKEAASAPQSRERLQSV